MDKEYQVPYPLSFVPVGIDVVGVYGVGRVEPEYFLGVEVVGSCDLQVSFLSLHLVYDYDYMCYNFDCQRNNLDKLVQLH